MPSLTLHKSLPLHTDRIWQLSAHPTLPLLATASADRTARTLSLTSYTPHSTIEGGHKRSIRTLSFQPNAPNPVLATGSFDATAGIWRLETPHPDDDDDASTDAPEWAFSVILDGHESEIKSLSWSAGGTLLATCSRDKTVWIWEELDEDNFETIAVLQEHTQDVKCVCWHPTDLLLASASYDDTVRLWRDDGDDWECCAVLTGHDGTVWSLSWEGSGERLCSVGDDLVGLLWAKKTPAAGGEGEKGVSILRGERQDEEWEVVARLPKAHERSVYSVDWSKRSGRIVTCGGDGRVVVYEEDKAAGEWKVLASVEGAHGVYEVNCAIWSKRFDAGARGEEEEIIVTCGDDGEVRIWTLEE